ncbi:hypothetical protein [Brevibacterium zhoupengii]|uniref:hypothetical protein n=1 Tax=Brevibacterium zhoupengii TaxID=2898795 RepID=UPI001F08F47D|nr:hypothetical protein [Brevibacterium zhoupengii]
MPNSPLAKVPYPSGSDAPAAAADMMALAMATDPRLVLPAIDEADRDARYSDAPVSTMVVSGESRKIWVKTGPAPTDWWTVYERQEYRTGFTALANWELDSAKAIRNTYTTEVRIRAIRTGPDLSADAKGNMPDQDIVLVPADIAATVQEFLVVGNFKAAYTSGSGSIKTDGIVKLYDMHPGSTIANGEMIWFSATWNN